MQKAIQRELAIFLIFFAVLSLWTFKRNILWIDPPRFWKDAVLKSPHKARPYNNLGTSFINLGRYEDALAPLRSSIEADRWYVEPHFNIAVAYIKLEMFDSAIPELEMVVRINEVLKSGHYGQRIMARLEMQAHSNLGNIYSLKGMSDDAVAHFLKALEIAPDDASIRYNLALTYKRQGRYDEALREFEGVLKIDPSDEGAMWNLRDLKGMKR